ncbi:MAG: hypothetical protein HY690_09600 [Chloroflexi bacterium]|nr:hypothetical protein [Chloroflexota bacterium]
MGTTPSFASRSLEKFLSTGALMLSKQRPCKPREYLTTTGLVRVQAGAT